MKDYKAVVNSMELPTKAMSYEGKFIERQIEGYLTFNVSGRESLEVNIQSDEVSVGSIIGTQQIKNRVLTIEYGLLSENLEDAQQKFNRLKQLLFVKNDVQISFEDESTLYYNGRLQKIDIPEYHSKEFATGKFEILCADPLKYSRTMKIGNSIVIDSPVETTPKKIEVKLASNNSVQIHNKKTGTKLKITGASIYKNDIVIFDFDKGKVFVNNIDRTAILDLASDFENFYIHRGDVLSCNNGKMTIYASEVYL